MNCKIKDSHKITSKRQFNFIAILMQSMDFDLSTLTCAYLKNSAIARAICKLSVDEQEQFFAGEYTEN